MFHSRKANGFPDEQLFVVPDPFLDRIRENPLSCFLTVTDIGYFPRAAYHFRERVRGCDTAILVFCRAGSGLYSLKGGAETPVSPGQVIVIPPNTPHRYRASEARPWSIYWVHVRGPFFQAFHENVASHLPLRLSDVMQQRIIDIFRQCFGILKMPYQAEEFFYLCQIVASMFSLINCVGKPVAPLTEEGNIALDKAFSFMSDHIHEMISRDQLLSVTKVSSSQLTSLFKRATGFAPIEYFLRTKIHAASQDLYFSKLPVQDIAGAYGIEDPYYFSRLFKKIMGLSPKNYRNRASG